MKQSEKLTQLLELMQANPELPVIPCVDGDVVSGDEYYCWLGSWGESAVQEFVIGRELYTKYYVCLYERTLRKGCGLASTYTHKRRPLNFCPECGRQLKKTKKEDKT